MTPPWIDAAHAQGHGGFAVYKDKKVLALRRSSVIYFLL